MSVKPMGKTAGEVIQGLRELLRYEEEREAQLRGKREKYAAAQGCTALYLEYSAASEAARKSALRLRLVLEGMDVQRVLTHFAG